MKITRDYKQGTVLYFTVTQGDVLINAPTGEIRIDSTGSYTIQRDSSLQIQFRSSINTPGRISYSMEFSN